MDINHIDMRVPEQDQKVLELQKRYRCRNCQQRFRHLQKTNSSIICDNVHCISLATSLFICISFIPSFHLWFHSVELKLPVVIISPLDIRSCPISISFGLNLPTLYIPLSVYITITSEFISLSVTYDNVPITLSSLLRSLYTSLSFTASKCRWHYTLLLLSLSFGISCDNLSSFAFCRYASLHSVSVKCFILIPQHFMPTLSFIPFNSLAIHSE